MNDLNTLPLQDLEALCEPGIVEFYRERARGHEDFYRGLLISYLTYDNRLIDKTLTAIRDIDDPDDAWEAVLEGCRHLVPEAPWNRLPVTDLADDIVEAREWLDSQVGCRPAVSGLYLGLDTLNMGDGDGENVEIGFTSSCDPLADSSEWLRKLGRGHGHLIRGLYELHSEYMSAPWQSEPKYGWWTTCAGVADEFLFFAYSGIVLGHALKRLKLPRRTVLAIWGFHDGDLYFLCRKTPTSFTFLCRSAPGI
jgi:hypothetical protein